MRTPHRVQFKGDFHPPKLYPSAPPLFWPSTWTASFFLFTFFNNIVWPRPSMHNICLGKMMCTVFTLPPETCTLHIPGAIAFHSRKEDEPGTAQGLSMMSQQNKAGRTEPCQNRRRSQLDIAGSTRWVNIWDVPNTPPVKQQFKKMAARWGPNLALEYSDKVFPNPGIGTCTVPPANNTSLTGCSWVWTVASHQLQGQQLVFLCSPCLTQQSQHKRHSSQWSGGSTGQRQWHSPQ